NKHFTQGFQLNASYTLARNQSDAGGAVPSSFAAENGATTLNLYRGDADFGDVAFTRRHRFVTTFLYQLPYGFDVAGVALLQSGPFLTPFFSNADPSGTGATVRGFTSSQRPDCTGAGNLTDPTADPYFDRAPSLRPASDL